MCTFNGAQYLREQLDSILRQTHGVQCLSVYDDGSTDDTRQVVESYAPVCAAKSIRLRFKANPRNLGYARNFSQALTQSTGDLVFLCDQDDVWYPEKVETLLHGFMSSKADMLFSNGELIDSKGNSINGGQTVLSRYRLSVSQCLSGIPSAYLLKRNYVNGAAAAIRKQALFQALPIPEGMPHDYWLALWCTFHNGLDCWGAPLYAYRLHDKNTIGIGEDRLIYDLAGIWRKPRASRIQDLHRTQILADRLVAHENTEIASKLKWLKAVVGEPHPFRRALNIGRSLLQGKYASFAPPKALLRDLVGLFR